MSPPLALTDERTAWRIPLLMRKLRKYMLVVETSLQSNMAYVLNFASDTMFYAIVCFVLMSLWRTVYSGGQPIPDYSGTQMMWYCVITELVYMSRCDVFGELTRAVQSGEIAYALNKPYDFLFYQFAQGTGLMLIKLAFNGAVGAAMGLMLIGPIPGFRTVTLLPAGLAILGGMILNTCLQACLGLLAFWSEDNSAHYWIYSKLVLMLGLMLPVEYFPDRLEAVVRFLPFSYITYGPARLVIAFTWERFLQTAVVQAVYIALSALLAVVVYRKGVKMVNVNGG
jgi:ABC-2 type transport system permease protein